MHSSRGQGALSCFEISVVEYQRLEVKMQRTKAKDLIRFFDTHWIYPPKPDREAAFAVANHDDIIDPRKDNK